MIGNCAGGNGNRRHWFVRFNDVQPFYSIPFKFVPGEKPQLELDLKVKVTGNVERAAHQLIQPDASIAWLLR